MIFFVYTQEKRDKREEARCADTTTAYVMTKGVIRQRLHDEANPYFPERPEISVKHLGECRHQVTGHFSSRDLNGRVGERSYVAVMRYHGNNYWQLESLEME